MKSNWIKKVLVIMLALILVFAVVACDKDDNPDNGTNPGGTTPGGTTPGGTTPGGTTPDDDDEDEVTTYGADFFESMWKSANAIGSEEFDVNKNFSLELALAVELAKANPGQEAAVAASEGYTSLELALDVKAYVDIESVVDNVKTGENTAVSVELSLSELYLQAFYFLSDPNTLYVKAGATSNKADLVLQKVPFEITGNDGTNYNDATWAAEIVKFLYKDQLNGTAENMPHNIIEVIGAITSGFGGSENSYVIDGIVANVIKAFGLNLEELTKDFSSILDTLGISFAGDWSLLSILKSLDEVIQFAPSVTSSDGKDVYLALKGREATGILDTMAWPAITGILNATGDSAILGGALYGLLDDNFEIGLGFTRASAEEGSDIDSFYLNVALYNYDEDTGLNAPYNIRVTINELDFANSSANTVAASEAALGITAEEKAAAKAFTAQADIEVVISEDLLVLDLPEYAATTYETAENGSLVFDSVTGSYRSYDETTDSGLQRYNFIRTDIKTSASGVDFVGTHNISIKIEALDLTPDGSVKATIDATFGDESALKVEFIPVEGDSSKSTLKITVTGGADSIARIAYNYAAVLAYDIIVDEYNVGTTMNKEIASAIMAKLESSINSEETSTTVDFASAFNLDLQALLSGALASGELNAVETEGLVVRALDLVAALLQQEGDLGLALSTNEDYATINDVIAAVIGYNLEEVVDLTATDEGMANVTGDSLIGDSIADILAGGVEIKFSDKGLYVKYTKGTASAVVKANIAFGAAPEMYE